MPTFPQKRGKVKSKSERGQRESREHAPEGRKGNKQSKRNREGEVEGVSLRKLSFRTIGNPNKIKTLVLLAVRSLVGLGTRRTSLFI